MFDSPHAAIEPHMREGVRIMISILKSNHTSLTVKRVGHLTPINREKKVAQEIKREKKKNKIRGRQAEIVNNQI